MSDKKRITIETKQKGPTRYYWNSKSNSVFRAEGSLFASDKKLGSAKCLDDAITIIKANHPGSDHQISIG